MSINNANFVLYTKDKDCRNFTSKSEKYGVYQISNQLYKRLMLNILHKEFSCEVEKDMFIRDFGLETDFDCEKINLIMMKELTLEQLESYLRIYENEPENLDKFAEYLSVITYEQVSPNNYNVTKTLNNLLESQSNYWDDSSNCKFSHNYNFTQRRFNNLEYITTSAIDQKVSNTSGKNSIFKLNVNYLDDISKKPSWTEFDFKMCYYITKPSSKTFEDVNNIYRQLPTEYLKYSFLTNLIVTRTHCHLVLNNPELLEMSKDIFEKYSVVFKYLIGYAWLTFKSEESIMKTRIKDTDRIIFDINTCNKLPVYPFTYDDLNQNPYACVLVSNDLIDLQNNCVALNPMKDYKKYYGMCDFEEFSRRLRIFINGRNTSGILDKIDWNSCVITGSAMTACGMKYNPLFDICRQNSEGELTDADINLFFLNYYANSDVDLICNHKSIYDFLDTAEKFINDLKDVCKKEQNNSQAKVNVDTVHTATIVVSDEFIGNDLENIKKAIGQPTADITDIKNNFDNQLVKNYFYNKYYVPWKNEQKEKIKSDNSTNSTNSIDKTSLYSYTEYLKLVPAEEFRIYPLDYDIEETDNNTQDYEKYYYLKDIYPEATDSNKMVAKVSESIRFKVGTNFTKTFEIFKSKDTDFFSVISRFHMGFVRAFYNGTTVKCLPSYITSMMLQLSTDYKYFASIRDPIEIVNKYRSRGFGIILNQNEKRHMEFYNTFKPKDNFGQGSNSASNSGSASNPGNQANKENKWIDIYGLNAKNKHLMFGPKDCNSDIFKPGKFFGGIPNDCFRNVNHKITTSFGNAFEDIISAKTSSIINYKVINDDGSINPLERYVIKMGWNKINSA